ncbi:hypothetical protein QFC21_003241 [Naganishia friedmannii]|uniref:Uncharacterized protein n=1 Tax=Naganishia friedmannii TaxID=89922 RepID=A0ACC2VRZ9_9TREE|nr:hypothetical protein QFC21_003241 [Naganishia friedmannii]
MAVMHDTDLHLVPGRSVGEFQLGDSLWHVLETMRANKVRYGGTSVRWDREDPTSPVIVDVPPGIRLVFPHTNSPHQQLLQLIALQLDSTATSDSKHDGDSPTTPIPWRSAYPGSLKLIYDNKHFATINSSKQTQQSEKERLTRSKITQFFGTTFSRRSPAPTSSMAVAGKAPSSNRSSPLPMREAEIRYPSIVFQLHPTTDGVEAVDAIIVVPPGREESVQPGRVWEVLDGRMQNRGISGWDAFAAISGEEVGLQGTIAWCEIQPHHGILLHINSSNSQSNATVSTRTTPYMVELWKTTGQDLLCDLGPPGRKYWKDDEGFAGRFGTTGQGTGAGAERLDGGGEHERKTSRGCWWNYFHLGLDFLVEELGVGKVMKIMVHSNIPGTAQFQTHARCPWTIRKPTTVSASAAPPISFKDLGYLSLSNTLDEFTAAFEVPASRRERINGDTSAAKVGGGRARTEMSTVLLDRLDEAFMSGIQDIEPSRLLALDGMILEEASGVGITSVLLH